MKAKLKDEHPRSSIPLSDGSLNKQEFKEVSPSSITLQNLREADLVEVKEVKEEKQSGEDKEFREELLEIEGIGPKTVEDILEIAPTREALKDLREENLPFRDSVEEKLKEEYK